MPLRKLKFTMSAYEGKRDLELHKSDLAIAKAVSFDQTQNCRIETATHLSIETTVARN